MVPVPVSLIERMLSAADAGLIPATIDRNDLRALLSQPTPTAEMIACPHWEPGRITMRKGCTACAATSVPSSITDMVPGTTFRDGKHQYTVEPVLLREVRRDDGQKFYADEIDPSTIRDVTPPTEGTK
jgi:hypothetical protein